MRLTKLLAIALGCLLALLVAVRLIAVNRVSDRDLIVAALNQSIQAGREGRPGGVLEHLSSNLSVNEQNPGARALIGRMIRDGKPDVQLSNVEPDIRGETATVISAARLRMTVGGMPVDRTFDEVRISFQKETGTRWLVIPSTEWRIVSVSVPGLTDLSQLAN